MFFGICHHYSYHYISGSMPCLTHFTAAYQKNTLSLSCYPSCKNVQKTSYLVINTIILYYYGMFSSWGVFTFSIMAVFSPWQGCVQLTRQLKNSTYIFLPIPIHPTHISPPHHKLYQIFTQFTKIIKNDFGTDFDKFLVFLIKINFQTIQNRPYLPPKPSKF